MANSRPILFILFLLFTSHHCNAQDDENKGSQQIVGGLCEGCEAVFEYGEKKLTAVDTLPNFEQMEPKLKLTGTVYQKDKKTPAADIILYIYHTNREGQYPTRGTEKDWAKRHGNLRGWVKTNTTGTFTFYTFRPAAYPNGKEPEHIHITVKEPNCNAYYIDGIVFDDDPLLTQKQRSRLGNRGGSGIVTPSIENEMFTVHRDIFLGFNIPNYE